MAFVNASINNPNCEDNKIPIAEAKKITKDILTIFLRSLYILEKIKLFLRVICFLFFITGNINKSNLLKKSIFFSFFIFFSHGSEYFILPCLTL